MLLVAYCRWDQRRAATLHNNNNNSLKPWDPGHNSVSIYSIVCVAEITCIVVATVVACYVLIECLYFIIHTSCILFF